MKITKEEALFYKLLIQTGFTVEVDTWINQIAENETTLEGVALDLVWNASQKSNLISILHNYTLEAKIDEKALHQRLRCFIEDKYIKKELTIKEVAETLYSFSYLMEKPFEGVWSDFSIIGEYYDLAVDGLINYDNFVRLVKEYLYTGNNLITDRFWTKRPKTLKEMIQKEKEIMNTIRFKINYIVVPIYFIIMIIILTTFGVLLSIDEEKFTFIALILALIFILLSIGLLISVPIVRKKETIIEMNKYDFTISNDKDNYLITSINGCTCQLSKDGITIGDTLYPYDDFCISAYYLSYMLTVSVGIEFALINTDGMFAPTWNFKLNNDLVNAINKFNINISNDNTYKYILNETYDAFYQILKYGYIKKYKKVKKND